MKNLNNELSKAQFVQLIKLDETLQLNLADQDPKINNKAKSAPFIVENSQESKDIDEIKSKMKSYLANHLKSKSLKKIDDASPI